MAMLGKRRPAWTPSRRSMSTNTISVKNSADGRHDEKAGVSMLLFEREVGQSTRTGGNQGHG